MANAGWQAERMRAERRALQGEGRVSASAAAIVNLSAAGSQILLRIYLLVVPTGSWRKEQSDKT